MILSASKTLVNTHLTIVLLTELVISVSLNPLTQTVTFAVTTLTDVKLFSKVTIRYKTFVHGFSKTKTRN